MGRTAGAVEGSLKLEHKGTTGGMKMGLGSGWAGLGIPDLEGQVSQLCVDLPRMPLDCVKASSGWRLKRRTCLKGNK